MAAQKKVRLDVLMLERDLVPSRAKAQAMIMAGEVNVNGTRVDKAGTRFTEDVEITLKSKPLYVSRGGEKLAGALRDFNFDVTGLIAADIGASTGGFTDCLLQNDVAKVYAIDVGYGQLAHKLRVDERVIVMERTNARYLENLPESINLVVIDASFISLKLLLPPAKLWLAPQADVIALIKPQFEAGKNDVGKGGVVKDDRIHSRVLRNILEFAQSLEFSITGLTISPIKGLKEGNTEFLVWLNQGNSNIQTIDIDQEIRHLLALK